MSGVFLFSMAATYFVCTSSNVKYSTVTAAPCFCAQRWAAASIALLVGSTYVLRIHSRRLVPFFTADAATPESAKAAEAPTAPARKLRRVRRASRMEAPPVFAALRSGGASAAEYRARGGPCQGQARHDYSRSVGSLNRTVTLMLPCPLCGKPTSCGSPGSRFE